MAAKKIKKNSSSLRFPFLFLFLTALGVGGWWLWQNSGDLKDHITHYIENSDIVTLESKYTPEQIMEAHRQELIGQDKRTYQEPSYKYYPYLMLEVKYTEDRKSREGILLWGLEDGEIVLNTETWETTHGFRDCLECQATRNDFKILYALALHGNTLPIEELQQKLQVERDILDSWLADAQEKHLIVQKGNRVQLHFENPKILVIPQTRMRHQLVSKPFVKSQKVAKNYSRSQIAKMAKAAFGNEFTIRSEKEIFLPVYSLSVLNADGSIHTSDWNAVNGQRLLSKYLTQALKD